MPSRAPQLLLLFCALGALAVRPAAQSPGPRFHVAIAVEASANPSVAGTEVTLTAKVTVLGPPTETLPTGTVEFFDGSVLLGTAEVTTTDGQTTASLTTPALTEGPHPILARYSGDDGFVPGASEPFIQIITAAVE